MDDSRSERAAGEAADASNACVFRRDGEYWTIVYDGRAIRLKDAKGLHCLARLLRHPGREFHAIDLVEIGGAGDDRSISTEATAGADLGGAGEALDRRAKAEYRRRLEDLREELSEAEGFNDVGRAARAREEIEAISRELAAGVGLGGRDRPTASHAERARVTVTQRVKTALAKIRESHPSLGHHLAASVKTGYFCSYDPGPERPVTWNDSPEPVGEAIVAAVPAPIAPPEAKAAAPAAPAAGTVPWFAATRFRTGAFAVAGAALIVLAVYTASTFRVGDSTPPSLPLPDKPSIAILPFANLSGDPQQDHFTTGLTEDLITDASSLSGLFVIAHDSVLPYKDKPVDVRGVGRDLGVKYVLEGSVRYVLEGSVRKSGDGLRINARLWDAGSGRQVWAQRYDRRLEEAFAIADDILRRIIGDLEVEVVDAELERVRHVPTENLSAYEAYLRGLDLASHCTSESVAEARQSLERAIDLDPSFAAAYAELGMLAVGEAYGPLAVHKLCAAGGLAPDRENRWPVLTPVLRRLPELSERALALDDSLPLAHVLTGFLEPGTPRAIAEADRAIALGPSDARAHALSAALYSTFAKPREAITLLEKAMRLNPRHPDWYSFHLGRAYLLAERHADAATVLEKVVLTHPDFLWGHIGLAAIYEKLDRQEEARLEYAAMLRLDPETAAVAEGEPPADHLADRHANPNDRSIIEFPADEAEACESAECDRPARHTWSPPAGPADKFFRLK